MLILGIETSCDETSAAVVRDGREVLSNVISSQVPLHQKYGGVVPELASRRHLELILPVIREALDRAGTRLDEIGLIGVTRGPGLIGALLVGISAAKALALVREVPLMAVNHLRGHLCANFLQTVNPPPSGGSAGGPVGGPFGGEGLFPLVGLIVSGGHTDLVRMRGHTELDLLGSTRDDAAGEAFDKVARIIGLGYPGGPLIDRLAKDGDAEAVRLPRAFLEEGSFDFSFSGLKTAVLQYWRRANGGRPADLNDPRERRLAADLAAGFQAAVTDVLVDKSVAALKATGCRRLLLAGGVAANSALRRAFEAASAAEGFDLSYPDPILCTDNAAMIAAASYYEYRAGPAENSRLGGWDLGFNAVSDLPLT